MDFDLTDEQLMLRATVERFGSEHCDPAKRAQRAVLDAAAPRSRWHLMAAQGWLALPLPEAQGGLGGDPVDVMVLMEGFGRHLIPEPFATTCVLALTLLAQAAGDAMPALAEAIGTGATQVAAALAESGAGFDLHRVATAARFEGGNFHIVGEKCHVENGADADYFIVAARTHGAPDAREGVSLFLLPRAVQGMTTTPYRSIDRHRHCRLRLDAVVNANALIGPLHHGLPLIEAAVDRTLAAYLAEAVGCMDRLRDLTLEYLKSRKQFGAAIGSFQALQHRMVDIAIACEEARSMLYHATLHLDAEVAIRRRAVAAAKARVGQLGLYVGRQCVQLHGGIGVTEEFIVSHYLRRLMMIELTYGNSDYHRAAFSGAA